MSIENSYHQHENGETAKKSVLEIFKRYKIKEKRKTINTG